MAGWTERIDEKTRSIIEQHPKKILLEKLLNVIDGRFGEKDVISQANIIDLAEKYTTKESVENATDFFKYLDGQLLSNETISLIVNNEQIQFDPFSHYCQLLNQIVSWLRAEELDKPEIIALILKAKVDAQNSWVGVSPISMCHLIVEILHKKGLLANNIDLIEYYELNISHLFKIISMLDSYEELNAANIDVFKYFSAPDDIELIDRLLKVLKKHESCNQENIKRFSTYNATNLINLDNILDLLHKNGLCEQENIALIPTNNQFDLTQMYHILWMFDRSGLLDLARFECVVKHKNLEELAKLLHILQGFGMLKEEYVSVLDLNNPFNPNNIEVIITQRFKGNTLLKGKGWEFFEAHGSMSWSALGNLLDILNLLEIKENFPSGLCLDNSSSLRTMVYPIVAHLREKQPQLSDMLHQLWQCGLFTAQNVELIYKKNEEELGILAKVMRLFSNNNMIPKQEDYEWIAKHENLPQLSMFVSILESLKCSRSITFKTADLESKDSFIECIQSIVGDTAKQFGKLYEHLETAGLCNADNMVAILNHRYSEHLQLLLIRLAESELLNDYFDLCVRLSPENIRDVSRTWDNCKKRDNTKERERTTFEMVVNELDPKLLALTITRDELKEALYKKYTTTWPILNGIKSLLSCLGFQACSGSISVLRKLLDQNKDKNSFSFGEIKSQLESKDNWDTQKGNRYHMFAERNVKGSAGTDKVLSEIEKALRVTIKK